MVDINRELRDFLRATRARITPADAGIAVVPGRAARRVPGLRREEVARAAGVSVDYYSRLEQGRTRQVSRSVIDAVAGALLLNETERDYLRSLVEPAPLQASVTTAPQRVRPGIQTVLASLESSPAFVVGRGTKILAMNALARALLFDLESRPPGQRNLAIWTFLAPEARERYVHWNQVAADTAAMLRIDATAYPDDAEIAAIVGQLSVQSTDFRQLWAEHHVFECTYGHKTFHHAVVGDLELDYEAMQVPGSTDQTLHVYTAPTGSTAARRLAALRAWSAPSFAPADLHLEALQDRASDDNA